MRKPSSLGLEESMKVGDLVLVHASGIEIRRFRNSDINDIRFAARALPYCDLMIVDGDLANRIRGLKLDRQYSTRIVGAKLPGYRDAAEWLRTDATTRKSA
jgi:hypothetical protein